MILRCPHCGKRDNVPWVRGATKAYCKSCRVVFSFEPISFEPLGTEPINAMAPDHGEENDATPPPPECRLITCPRDAEESACRWLRWMGFADAEVTAAGSDGGVDIRSSKVVAQVK